MEEKKAKKIKPWAIVLIVIGSVFALYIIVVIVVTAYYETCGTYPGGHLDCMPTLPYEGEESEKKESLCERAHKIPWCRVVY